MESEKLDALCEKVGGEYTDFISGIKKQNDVEAAIESAYEIVWKDNINQYIENEDIDLSEKQCDALLSSKNTLDEIYEHFEKWDGINSYSDLGIVIKDTADRIIEAETREREAHMKAPVILHDLKTARSMGESGLEDFRTSRNENIACARALIAAVKENSTYGDTPGVTYFEAKKAIEDVLSKGYPAERVGYVIASQAVRNQNYLDRPQIIDGRFSRSVKDWAVKMFSRQNNFPFKNFEECDITSKVHHTLVNSLAEKFIDKQLELSADAEKKPSVLGEIGKLKAEQKAKEIEKPAPQKAKSNEQTL